MPDTETVDVFDFVTLISPESGNLNGAKGALKMAGMGFYIDLEKAKDAGLGRFVREISHDAQTGAPRLKLQDNLAMMELALKALADRARIYGMENARPAAASPVEDSRRLIAAVLENGDPRRARSSRRSGGSCTRGGMSEPEGSPRAVTSYSTPRHSGPRKEVSNHLRRPLSGTTRAFSACGANRHATPASAIAPMMTAARTITLAVPPRTHHRGRFRRPSRSAPPG
jgi:hypothetical protein